MITESGFLSAAPVPGIPSDLLFNDYRHRTQHAQYQMIEIENSINENEEQPSNNFGTFFFFQIFLVTLFSDCFLYPPPHKKNLLSLIFLPFFIPNNFPAP